MIAHIRIRPAALLLALAAACERAPTETTAAARRVPLPAPSIVAQGGAERNVQERIYDLSGSRVAFPCGDGYTEEVLMEGKMYERWVTTLDGAGGVHATLHTMPIGLRGVGLTSGAEYRVTEREQVAFTQTLMAGTGSYQHFLTVAAPALGLRLRLVIGGRFVLNANGEYVVEQPTLRGECRQ